MTKPSSLDCIGSAAGSDEHLLVEPTTTSCLICDGDELTTIVGLPGLPVDIGRLWPDSESAKAAPRGDMLLSFCHRCGFVFNSAYDPEKLDYQPGYECSLHHSPIHREFLEQTADRLIESYDLHGKDIVEVGCGSGHFLQLLCERGGNRGWGFDPAIDEERVIKVGQQTVTLSRQYYDESRRDIPCDLLVSRSMFDQIPQPIEFLHSMRRTLGERSEARFYLDIPNTSYVFRHRSLWNLFYEQCSYFVKETLVNACDRTGFSVLDAGECLGEGYYLYVEAKPSGDQEPPSDDVERLSVPGELVSLADHFADQRDGWRRRFDGWAEQGKRVVAWGSGGRAINFLNMTNAGDWIDHIVDINPARHGGFVSCSGQQIIAPEALLEMCPDVVVITNGLYGAEIRDQVASLGLACEFSEI